MLKAVVKRLDYFPWLCILFNGKPDSYVNRFHFKKEVDGWQFPVLCQTCESG